MPNESTSLLQTNFVHEVEPIITVKDTNFTYSTAKTASTNLDASNNPTPVYENVGDFVVKDSTNATMMSVTTQYRSLSGTYKELVLFVSPKGNTSNSISMHFEEDGTKYINVNNATISNVKSPSGNTDAATKGYVDETVDEHADNTTKHVTDTERSTWNGKQNTTLGTANVVVVTNGSKTITASSITTTELGYLDGVTSNVQEQLNGKEASGAVSTHNGSTAAHASGFAHALPMNNNKITGLATPTASTDAATKGYVDGLPGVDLQIVSGIYTCTGDQNNTVIYINHGHKNASGQSVAPKMVFACMYGHTSGGDMTMASGTVTMIVFATIPMTNGVLSTTQISFLVPDVTTSTSTKIMWTALFDQ
ncbi:MAG: hypothetical protein IKA36_04205 [Clostridia bacterium]|nr:hypothetical protein [Clostridia bacterium]